MPIKSKAQQRLMYAAKEGDTKKVPKKVAEEFIEKTPKKDYKKMPEKKKKG